MLQVGDSFRFSKTISESDVYLFAGITGDFSPNHINEEFCKKTFFGTRIAHGSLTLSLCSPVCNAAAAQTGKACLLTGMDHVRFLKPVYLGDTVTAVFTTTEIDQEKNRFTGKCEVFNQRQELVLVSVCHQIMLED